MHMGGGGAFNVAAGQLTDDSELAISLLRGLVGVRPQDGFPAEAVAGSTTPGWTLITHLTLVALAGGVSDSY
ncbi:MAG: hypothetical protein WDW38_006199 [Sanguina aurantia]